MLISGVGTTANIHSDEYQGIQSRFGAPIARRPCKKEREEMPSRFPAFRTNTHLLPLS
jgi:hypothetical protein